MGRKVQTGADARDMAAILARKCRIGRKAKRWSSSSGVGGAAGTVETTELEVFGVYVYEFEEAQGPSPSV